MIIFPYIAFPDCVMVAPQILVLIVGVRVLLGEIKHDTSWILWSLRLSVRTKDSQSLKRGSIPLGTVRLGFPSLLFFKTVLLSKKPCKLFPFSTPLQSVILAP